MKYAAWLKSVNPNKLADAFHVELAQIQIAELESAGLLVLDPSSEALVERAARAMRSSAHYMTAWSDGAKVLTCRCGVEYTNQMAHLFEVGLAAAAGGAE